MYVASYAPSGLPLLLGIRPVGGGAPFEAPAQELQQRLLAGCAATACPACPATACPACPATACPACPRA